MCYLYLDWYRCAILISTGVLVLLPACEGNYGENGYPDSGKHVQNYFTIFHFKVIEHLWRDAENNQWRKNTNFGALGPVLSKLRLLSGADIFSAWRVPIMCKNLYLR